MCPRLNHKVSIGSLILLVAFYGCTAKAPISEARKNQEVLGASTGALKSAPSAAQRSRANDTRPGDFSEHRYKIESFSLNCIDETGIDFLGSDHARIIIDAVSTTHIDFRNVDAGDIRIFAPGNSCILPINGPPRDLWTELHHVWACTNTGISGPFTFNVELYEVDDLLTMDDVIGRRTLQFTAEELAAAMPNVNDTFTESITLVPPCEGNNVCTKSPFDSEYRFTYRLTRLPDRPPVIGPVP
jgi:hypothetical protein